MFRKKRKKTPKQTNLRVKRRDLTDDAWRKERERERERERESEH